MYMCMYICMCAYMYMQNGDSSIDSLLCHLS